MKRCPHCKKLLPTSEFYKDPRTKDCLRSWCKNCSAASDLVYRKINKDKIAAQRRLHSRKNKDTIAIYGRNYYKANKEKILKRAQLRRETNKKETLERERLYRKANRDRIAKQNRVYEKANKKKKKKRGKLYRQTHDEIIRVNRHRRRARIHNCETEQFFDTEIFERDCWVCQICGKHVDETLKHPHPRSKSLDHIVPISRGGNHTRKNVQLAHLVCNIRKQAQRCGQLRLIG